MGFFSEVVEVVGSKCCFVMRVVASLRRDVSALDGLAVMLGW